MPTHHIKVVGWGGSLATPSASLAALKIALAGAAGDEAKTQLFDVAALNLPMYVPGTEDVPDAALQMSEEIYEADGLIWSSPMYHGTISGLFKKHAGLTATFGRSQAFLFLATKS